MPTLTLSSTVIFRELAGFIHEELKGRVVFLDPPTVTPTGTSLTLQPHRPMLAGAHAKWSAGSDATFVILPTGGDAAGHVPSRRWDAALVTTAGSSSVAHY